MKNKICLTVSLVLLAGAALVTSAFDVPTQALRSTAPVSQDLVVTNQNNTVGVLLNKNTTNDLIVARNGGTKQFGVSSNGTLTVGNPAATKIGLGFYRTNVAMGASFTASNSWNGAFSGTPTVMVSGAVTNESPCVVGANATGVIVGVLVTNQQVYITAIGPP